MKILDFQARAIKIKTTLYHFSAYCTVLEAQLLPLFFFKINGSQAYY